MGIPTLISTTTASGAANVSITSGIDSTYDEYMFVITDWNPATDVQYLTFQCSIDGGSNYNVPIVTSYFRIGHFEDDSWSTLAYVDSFDEQNTTNFQKLDLLTGNDADQTCAGILHLFSPASTTYVKNFYARFNSYYNEDATIESFVAGYFNDADDDINAIQFKQSSGNIDSVVQMYGIA